MNALTQEHLNFVLSRLPRDIRDMMKERNLYLAGGFIRATILGERVNDIDLLGPDKEALHSAAKDLALSRQGRVHSTDNAYTVLASPRFPVQFIHRWLYDDPEQLLAEFDFTIAQAVIWWDGEHGVWRSRCADTYYPDLASRTLRYTAPKRAEDVGGSLLRARKFIAKGYILPAPQLAAVISRLTSGVEWQSLREHDEPYVARILTGLLREVDPLMVVDGVDLVDEHEVGNDEA